MLDDDNNTRQVVTHIYIYIYMYIYLTLFDHKEERMDFMKDRFTR